MAAAGSPSFLCVAPAAVLYVRCGLVGAAAAMDMDATLMTVVNVMGVVVFALVVAFHVLTATPKDVDA